ncbi:Transcriptional regulator of ribosomal biogenesis proteins [Coemansia sp. RSA 552]|nr:Transcriptional regulator of ribosomal biogenesis proteins [Coemansia sp. RSA 552]
MALFDLAPSDATSMADDDLYYSRDLEANFCRDFSCCGEILSDLHDLLQHYEECHVRFEDDDTPGDIADGCFFGADEWNPDLSFGLTIEQQQLMLDSTASSTAHTSPVLSAEPKPSATRSTPPLSPSDTAASSVISSPLESTLPFPADSGARKRSSAADHAPPLKRQATRESSAAPPKTHSASVLGLYDDDIIAAIASATDPLFLSSVAAAANGTGDKSVTHDDISRSQLARAASAAVVAVSGEDSDDEVHLPPSVTAAMAGAVAAAAAAKAHGLLPRDDKPYRCPVPGCDKAYKNPNGLKYHNLHGHCTLNEDAQGVSKPYKCRVPDCYKAYKNLNGLKYHVQHAHCAMIPSLRDLPPNATPAEVAAAVAAAAAAGAVAAASSSSAATSPAPSAPASPIRGPMNTPAVPSARLPARAPPHSAGVGVPRHAGPLPRAPSAPGTLSRTHSAGMPPRQPFQRNGGGALPSRPAVHGTARMPPPRRPINTSGPGDMSFVSRPRNNMPLAQTPARRPATSAPATAPPARQQQPHPAAATC